MLYGWYDAGGCRSFTNSLPHIDPPMWAKDFKLWFVSPKDFITLLYCPVFVHLGKLEPFEIILLPQQWLLDSNSAIYIYMEENHHHHHHIVPLAWISLTLSRHPSLSFITFGRSSGLHPVSSHSCCMYVRAGRPAFAWPYAGVHRSTSLMSSSLLLQQCPACLARLTCIVFVMGGKWPHNWCLVGCCHQDLFNIARNILVWLPSSFFFSHLVSVQVVHPYSSINMTAAWKKLRFILLVRSDFHMIKSLSIAVHAFVSRVSISFLIDETLLPR